MMKTKEKFQALLKQYSSEVDEIIKIMKHPNKESARNFLCVVSAIIDYYNKLDKQEDNKVYQPVVRISHAPNWAKGVLAEFLTLKLSLYHNSDTIEELRKKFYPSAYGRTECAYARERRYNDDCRTYLRTCGISRPQRTESSSGYEYAGNKNVLFCGSNHLENARNRFLNEFMGKDSIATRKNLIVCQELKVDDILKQLDANGEKGREFTLKIDNIFFLYGEAHKDSLHYNDFETLNSDYNVGIKSCFVFYISDTPFCLKKTIAGKNRFTERILGYPDNNYQHYIAFDEAESNLMFDQKNQYQHIVIKNQLSSENSLSADAEYFCEVAQSKCRQYLKTFLEGAQYPLSERNLFSLCCSDSIKFAHQKYLKRFENYDVDSYDKNFYTIYKDAAAILTQKLRELLPSSNNDYKIAFVVGKNTSKSIKEELQSFISTINKHAKVVFYNYSALSPKDNKNKITERIVFVLSYRPHYCNMLPMHHKYPNSFDPFVVNPNQKIYDFIMDIIFKERYKLDLYYYNLEFYKILWSKFRCKCLDVITKPERPVLIEDDDDYYSETEFPDESQSSSETVCIEFCDKSHITIATSEYVLFEYQGRKVIKRISELEDVLRVGSRCQKLDDISDYIKNKQTTDDGTSQPRWQEMLTQRVRELGEENVLNAINHICHPHSVSQTRLTGWINGDIQYLPNDRKDQKALMEYLGLEKSYLIFMRSKKNSGKKNTRSINNMINEFLCRTLLVENIDDKIYEDLSDSLVNYYLEFEDLEQLQNIVADIRTQINLKEITKITYNS